MVVTPPVGLSTLGNSGVPILESDGAVMPPAPLEGVLTVPGVVIPGLVMSLTLPMFGVVSFTLTGAMMLETLCKPIVAGRTLVGASSWNCGPTLGWSGLLEGVLAGVVVPLVLVWAEVGVATTGATVYAVTPTFGVLTVLAVLIALPVEKVGLIVFPVLEAFGLVTVAGGVGVAGSAFGAEMSEMLPGVLSVGTLALGAMIGVGSTLVAR